MKQSMSLQEFETIIKNTTFVEFNAEQDKQINKEFKKKWGYSIPDTLVEETINGISKYKTVPQVYIETTQNDETTIKIQNTFKPILMLNVQQVNRFYTPQELKEKIATTQNSINKIKKENANLRQEIKALTKQSTNVQKQIPTKFIQQRSIIFQDDIPALHKKYILTALRNDYGVRNNQYLIYKMKMECNQNDVESIKGYCGCDILWKYKRNNNILIIKYDNSDNSSDCDTQ